MSMLVSVIIPCYNVAEFLTEGLDSIINQTYKDLEIVCLDDSSTDTTKAILQQYADRDRRIKVFYNEENKGLIFSLNKLVNLATSEFLLRMDPDDVAELGRVELLVNKITNTNADLVSSAYSLINDKSQRITKKGFDLLTTPLGISYTAIFNSPFPHAPALYKKSIFDKFCYDVNYKSAEDYKLWTDLLLSDNFKGEIIDQELYRYRINQGGMSISNADLQANNHIKIAKNYTEKLLSISTEGFDFWSIAKKKYTFKNYKDLVLQLLLVEKLRKQFIVKFNPSKSELKEINSYTFQYLIYLYKNIWEMACKGSLNKAVAIKSIFRSVVNTLNLFNFKNIKWIVQNI